MNESDSSASLSTIGAVVLLFVLSATTALSQMVTAPPQINAVVDSASLTPELASGELISIFGTNLANAAAQDQSTPLPTNLFGLTVTLNQLPLPLLYVSATQVNAQIPFDFTGSGSLQVLTPNGSTTVNVTVSNVAPAIFAIPFGQSFLPAATHASGVIVSASVPAQPGEFISIYMTGLGRVNGGINAGDAAPSSPLLTTVAPVQVQLGTGAPIPSTFAGLAPGFVGLYQVNFQVPQLASGTYALTVLAGSATSNPLPLTIANPSVTPNPVPPTLPAVNHYEYVFPDGSMYVYDMDNGFKLLKQIRLPQAQAIRGVVASPPTHTLYISYGGDGGPAGTGSMLAYDLLTDQVLWSVNYSTGIDSMAITPDGKTIYMPTGELNPGTTWNVMDASNGNVIGSINAGAGPHNTVVSLDGSQVYMGPRYDNFLYVASTATNTVTRKIGPLVDTVRPFTINGRETLAFTTATQFLGFQVSDLRTGQVLYTERVAGFSAPPNPDVTAPSHGISLSPDEKEIWIIDAPNSAVHLFDVSGLPGSPPMQVADLPLSRPMTGLEDPCTYDCNRDGWVQHSRDGRYVFVGDSGDVFDTAKRQVVINLDPLYNTRKHLEIDWQDGQPVSTTSRYGLGYLTQ